MTIIQRLLLIAHIYSMVRLYIFSSRQRSIAIRHSEGGRY